MSKLIDKVALTFDDVLIEPGYSNIGSREEVDLSSEFIGLKLKLPIVSANMDYITEARMAHAMWEAGGVGILHRFADLENEAENQARQRDWIESLHTADTPAIISVGVRHPQQTMAWLASLDMSKIHAVCIDVAHGHMQKVQDLVEKIRATYPKNYIIAGNVATAAGYEALAKAGADAIKAGIGGGCLGAGTRILMGNGTYRNIEDVKIGDIIIDGTGNPQKVLGTKFSGYKQVIYSRHTSFYKPLTTTPEHPALVGDLSGLSRKTITSLGYRKALSRNKKTRGFPSRIQWRGLAAASNDCLLTPRVINFDLPPSFKIDLRDYAIKPKYLEHYNSTLTNSYDLGYIFGLFMGDGNSRVQTQKNSLTGSAHWALGPKEGKFAEKLADSLERVIGVRPKIIARGKSKLLLVSNYCLPLAKVLFEFGKRTEKHLPEQYLCGDREYLTGLWDGLIDSDGNTEKSGRIGFSNTSIGLVELVSFLSKILFGSFPEIATRGVRGSKLIPDNGKLSVGYQVRLNSSHEKRLFETYQAVKLMAQTEELLLLPTYDLEIENSHSFIANNVIVHNSVCTTRVVTGIGVPQLSAIMDCAEAKEKLNEKTALIADGGIRNSGDIVKALAGGADVVMVGRLLAGAEECPTTQTYTVHQSADGTRMILSGPVSSELGIKGDGTVYRQYRGQSTFGSNKDRYTKEGVSGLVEAQGPVREILRGLTEGVRSGMSYVGARTLPELRERAVFRTVYATSLAESGPRVKTSL